MIATTQMCPLCKTPGARWMCRDEARDYFRCGTCGLVFVPPTQFVSPEAEKTRYDLHQNSPQDAEYRKFLNRLLAPMCERLAPGSRGLDFGSGPAPTLSLMFQERGHSMAIYDPFYARDSSVLEHKYDFITLTEVVEHLHEPGKELDRLWSILKPGGLLGIMTRMPSEDCRMANGTESASRINVESFVRWHYRNDLTHICFYSQSAFEWLAARWHAELTFADKDVILLSKKL
jgi:SAM-dependent methyltransferase